MKRIQIILLAWILCITGILCSCNQPGGGETPVDETKEVFDLQSWAGEYAEELTETVTAQIPDNYVIPRRLEGETTDTPAIERALEQIRTDGGCLFFPESSYTINKPIVIYKNVSYIGRGVGQTVIKVEKGANCDAFVSDQFDLYVNQQRYGMLNSAYFGPSSTLPQNFSIQGLTIDGGANFKLSGSGNNIYVPSGNVMGYGIKIFGKRFQICDVQVQNIAEVGVYVEYNSTEVTAVDTSFNYFICSEIDGLRVISTGEEGLVYRGPSDQQIGGLWVCSSCLTGKTTIYQNYENWELGSVIFEDKDSINQKTPYSASPELGFAHIWRGFHSWGLIIVGQLRFKADHVIIESTYGGLKTSKHCYSQISILDVHNCMFGGNDRPYLLLQSTAHTKISNLEIRYGYDSTNKDMIWMTGNNITIGECELRANYDVIGAERAGGHGAVISGCFNQITGLNAMYFAGKGSDGATASAVVLTGNRNIISGVITYSSVGVTVADSNNVVSLATRTDSTGGQIAVKETKAGLLTSMDLTITDYNALTGWSKYPNQIVSTGLVRADTTEVQTLIIAHGCTICPEPKNVQLTLINESSVTDFKVAYLAVKSVDERYVTVQIVLSAASATSGAKLGLSISVGN